MRLLLLLLSSLLTSDALPGPRSSARYRATLEAEKDGRMNPVQSNPNESEDDLPASSDLLGQAKLLASLTRPAARQADLYSSLSEFIKTGKKRQRCQKLLAESDASSLDRTPRADTLKALLRKRPTTQERGLILEFLDTKPSTNLTLGILESFTDEQWKEALTRDLVKPHPSRGPSSLPEPDMAGHAPMPLPPHAFELEGELRLHPETGQAPGSREAASFRPASEGDYAEVSFPEDQSGTPPSSLAGASEQAPTPKPRMRPAQPPDTESEEDIYFRPPHPDASSTEALYAIPLKRSREKSNEEDSLTFEGPPKDRAQDSKSRPPIPPRPAHLSGRPIRLRKDTTESTSKPPIPPRPAHLTGRPIRLRKDTREPTAKPRQINTTRPTPKPRRAYKKPDLRSLENIYPPPPPEFRDDYDGEIDATLPEDDGARGVQDRNAIGEDSATGALTPRDAAELISSLSPPDSESTTEEAEGDDFPQIPEGILASESG